MSDTDGGVWVLSQWPLLRVNWIQLKGEARKMWLLHSSWERRVGDCSDEGIDFTECGDISDNIGDTSDHQYLE